MGTCAKVAKARVSPNIPQPAIDYLKAHPETAPQFDQHFNLPGAAARILKGAQ